MAVSSMPISTKLAVVLNNGQTSTGKTRTKSVDVGGNLKSTAGNTPCYNVAAAVKALYSEPLVRYQKTSVVALISN